jgi:hypothetical protein
MRQKRLPSTIPCGLYISPFLLAQKGGTPQPQTGATSYTYEKILITSMHQTAGADYFFPIMKTELAPTPLLIKIAG